MHINNRTAAARVGSLATVAVLALGSLGVAAPAQAETVGFRDARGDMGHKADIWNMRVVNEGLVRVKIQHQNLTAQGTKGALVFLDTVRGKPGPEFVFVAGIFEGSDYQLLRMESWKRKGDPLNCDIDLELGYRTDVSHFSMRRKCLDRPASVRVAVKVEAEGAQSGTFAHDWLRGRREFTRWVARG